MDRTSKIGLFFCLGLLLTLTFVQDKYFPPPKPKPRPVPVATANSTTASGITAPGETPIMTSGTTAGPTAPPEEKLTVLENDAMKVTFTNIGAAIKTVELKLQKADNGGNIVLNEGSNNNILAVTGWPGVDTANFVAKQNLGVSITFSAALPNGLQWERTYAFGRDPDKDTGLSGFLRSTFHKVARKLGHPEPKPEVYSLDVSDKLSNPGAADITLPVYSIAVGRALPLHDPAATLSAQHSLNLQYAGSGWLANKLHFTGMGDFNSSGWFGLVVSRPARDHISSIDVDNSSLRWLGVQDQFFTVLLTPGAERSIQHAEFTCLNQRDSTGAVVPELADPLIEASAYFPALTVPAGKAIVQSYSLYSGPKDFNRLDALGDDQGALMQYDGFLPFSLLIVPMLTILKFWYLIFNNYGVAIILLTLMIKAITWPLQSIANRSGKRMQALAPKLKELQAKYKETPEKLQTETFALYKDYGVNPFGGCLPALIQMPVFFSLYFMLQNAVELRGQHFLWVHDLTKPDAVWTAPFLFWGFHPSIHPLPIMVTALTVVMMRMTPQIGDPQQAKIAQIMPIFFLFIFYNFAAALSLYYVINNFVSIIQIYRNLKKPMPELVKKPKK